MDFIINDLPAQPAVYMRRTGEYGTENYQLMERFKKWAGGKGLLKSGVIYGIAWGNVNTPPEKCRYDICMAVPAKFPPDDEVEFCEIPGGKYAIFTIAHTAEAVTAFWRSVFQLLQEKDLRTDANRPIMERYQYTFVEDGKCEFCVPIM